MTEDRKKLIAKFQKWLDTNPRKELIASQCANIAEEYHSEQSILSAVSGKLKVGSLGEKSLTQQIYELEDSYINADECDDMSAKKHIGKELKRLRKLRENL